MIDVINASRRRALKEKGVAGRGELERTPRCHSPAFAALSFCFARHFDCPSHTFELLLIQGFFPLATQPFEQAFAPHNNDEHSHLGAPQHFFRPRALSKNAVTTLRAGPGGGHI